MRKFRVVKNNMTTKIQAQFATEPVVPVEPQIKVTIRIRQSVLDKIERHRQAAQPPASLSAVVGYAVEKWAENLQ